VAGVVAQADLAPTLLDVAGLAADGMDGVSLRAAIDGAAPPAQAAYSETLYPRYHFGWSELYAVTEGRYRYVRAPRPELFDLSGDPHEKTTLAADRASVAAAMDRWLEPQVALGAGAKPEDVPSEVREKLQALGYVGSGGAPSSSSARPDPKDRIGVYEEFRQGLALRRGGRRAEAVAQLRKVVAANPDMRDAWEMLGVTLLEMDRKKEAIAALDRTIALDPTRATRSTGGGTSPCGTPRWPSRASPARRTRCSPSSCSTRRGSTARRMRHGGASRPTPSA
jgi:tetratricopeptide (TPR) repeat protein